MTREQFFEWPRQIGGGLTVLSRESASHGWTATALTVEKIFQMPEIDIEIAVRELYSDIELPETAE